MHFTDVSLVKAKWHKTGVMWQNYTLRRRILNNMILELSFLSAIKSLQEAQKLSQTRARYINAP